MNCFGCFRNRRKYVTMIIKTELKEGKEVIEIKTTVLPLRDARSLLLKILTSRDIKKSWSFAIWPWYCYLW